jgi:hypothetical protein
VNTYTINVNLPPGPEEQATLDQLAGMQQQIAALKTQLQLIQELAMSIVTDLQAKVSAANAAMAASTLTTQRLRQALDASLEQLALAQAAPVVPAGAVVLTAADVAALDATTASLADSTQGLMDATEANALPAVTPAP